MYSQTKLLSKEVLWPLLIFIAVIFTAAEAPYSFVFETRLQKWQVVLDIIFSAIFICDIYFNLKALKKKNKTKKFSKNEDYNKTKENILLGIDIFACIPFDLIFYLFGLGPSAKFLKLLRMGRLVRIIKLYEILNALALIPRYAKLGAALILSLIVMHWFTLFWIFLHPVGARDHTTYYIECYYWTVTTLTTVGYGDITPTTNIARIYTMFVMLLGVGVYGVVIGNISRIFAESAKRKEQLREKFSDLSIFMKHYHIPGRLQSSVFNYYDHIYTKRLSDNDTKIIADLPQALKQELQVYMNMKLIRNLTLFKKCSQSCLKEVAASLEQHFYAPGDTIIHIGEEGEEMYIIGHGSVDIITNDGTTVAQLHEGQFFGEAALLVKTTRNANVRSSAYCDLYKLSKDSFLEIIGKYPELKEVMEKNNNKRSSD
jgi:voltage-gated potassium channel